MVDNNSIDLRRKNADLTDAIGEGDRARQDQFAAAARANSAKRKARELEVENAKLKAMIVEKDTLIEKQAKALLERNLTILEWMHGNSSYKRLAKKYAESLEISHDIYNADLDRIILDVAEESPQFKETKFAKSVKLNDKC